MPVRVLLLVALAVLAAAAAEAIVVTMDDVADHAFPDDCWSALYGQVFDLTAYAPRHPNRGGGSTVIYEICGTDGTAEFDRHHANDRGYLTSFSSVVYVGELGMLEPTTPVPTYPTTEPVKPTTIPVTPAPTIATDPTMPSVSTTISPTFSETEIVDAPSLATPVPTSTQTAGDGEGGGIIITTLEQLAEHDTPDDCYVLFYETVYDLTAYARDRHPTGGTDIYPYCGRNGTRAFLEAGHEAAYLTIFLDEEEEVLGPIGGGSAVAEVDSDTPQRPPSDSIDPDSATSPIIITTDEIAEHDDLSSSCWIVLYDTVYDVTGYASVHPGPGSVAIEPWCGLPDATEAYRPFHSRSLLDDYEGLVVGTTTKEAATELRERTSSSLASTLTSAYTAAAAASFCILINLLYLLV